MKASSLGFFHFPPSVNWVAEQPFHFLQQIHMQIPWHLGVAILAAGKGKWFICKMLRRRKGRRTSTRIATNATKKKNDQMSPLLLSLLPHLHLHLNADADYEDEAEKDTGHVTLWKLIFLLVLVFGNFWRCAKIMQISHTKKL